MRKMLLSTMIVLAMAPALGWASPSAISNETVTTEPAPDKAESPTAIDAKPQEAFTPPPPVGAYGRPELYDLQADPLAASDVAARHPDQLAGLHALLLEHLAAHGASEAVLDLWQRAAEKGAQGSWAIDYPDRTV